MLTPKTPVLRPTFCAGLMPFHTSKQKLNIYMKTMKNRILSFVKYFLKIQITLILFLTFFYHYSLCLFCYPASVTPLSHKRAEQFRIRIQTGILVRLLIRIRLRHVSSFSCFMLMLNSSDDCSCSCAGLTPCYIQKHYMLFKRFCEDDPP